MKMIAIAILALFAVGVSVLTIESSNAVAGVATSQNESIESGTIGEKQPFRAFHRVHRKLVWLKVGGTIDTVQAPAPPDFVSISELDGDAVAWRFGRGTVKMLDTNDFTPLINGTDACVLHLSTQLTLTAGDGSQVTAEALDPDDGQICVTSFDPFQTEIKKSFTVTGGTGRFEGASGFLRFKATGSISDVSTFDGTLRGLLRFEDRDGD